MTRTILLNHEYNQSSHLLKSKSYEFCMATCFFIRLSTMKPVVLFITSVQISYHSTTDLIFSGSMLSSNASQWLLPLKWALLTSPRAPAIQVLPGLTCVQVNISTKCLIKQIDWALPKVVDAWDLQLITRWRRNTVIVVFHLFDI